MDSACRPNPMARRPREQQAGAVAQTRMLCSRVILIVSAVIVLAGCREEPGTSGQRSRADRSPASQTEWQRTPGGGGLPTTISSAPVQVIVPTSAPLDGAPRALRPLAESRVGRWARYRLAGGFEQRLEVVAIEDDEVSVKLEMWLKGQPAGLPAVRKETTDVDWALRAAGQHKADVTTHHTTLTVAGRTWQTRLTIARWRFEGVNYEQRTWTAADGPIYGVIKMLQTADDSLAASMDLIAFGDSAGKVK